MSTAVLISGQMRTFARCYPTQRWQIFRHYQPEIYFYVSCCDDDEAKSAELLREHYRNVHIEYVKDPADLTNIPREQGAAAPYANAAGHDRLMLQHWGVKRTWEFYQRTTKIQHDTVIRIRPDLWIHRFRKPVDPCHNEAFLPWWGKFGGVNDRLAIMGPAAAEAYFNVFDQINDLLGRGCPFHPESLTAAALYGMNARNTLLTEFSTMRMDGSQRWAEIASSDMAELMYG